MLAEGDVTLGYGWESILAKILDKGIEQIHAHSVSSCRAVDWNPSTEQV